MKFHIIRANESLDDIAKYYNLNVDEVKSENRHIKTWDRLVPGTKLKIPVISETITNEINEMEPFIEDYYPKVKNYNYDEIIIPTEQNEIKNESDLINVEPKRDDEINDEIIDELKENIIEEKRIESNDIEEDENDEDDEDDEDDEEEYIVYPYYPYPSYYGSYFYPYKSKK